MTTLRQRMLEDMSIRNLAENTKLSYLQHLLSATHLQAPWRSRATVVTGKMKVSLRQFLEFVQARAKGSYVSLADVERESGSTQSSSSTRDT